MKTLLVILVCFFGFGCNRGYADCGGEMTYQPKDWSVAELAAMFGAANAWNELAGYKALKLEEGGERDDMCHIQPAAGPLEKGDANGMYELGPGRIQIVPGFSAESESIWIHEMGHSLGLDHVEGSKHSYMHPNAGDEFTAEDWEECHRVGVCF